MTTMETSWQTDKKLDILHENLFNQKYEWNLFTRSWDGINKANRVTF